MSPADPRLVNHARALATAPSTCPEAIQRSKIPDLADLGEGPGLLSHPSRFKPSDLVKHVSWLDARGTG